MLHLMLIYESDPFRSTSIQQCLINNVQILQHGSKILLQSTFNTQSATSVWMNAILKTKSTKRHKKYEQIKS